MFAKLNFYPTPVEIDIYRQLPEQVTESVPLSPLTHDTATPQHSAFTSADIPFDFIAASRK